MMRRLRRLDELAINGWRRFRSADSAWDGVADLVTARPLLVLLVAVSVLSVPLLALPTLQLDHNTLAQLPPEAESVRGFDALGEHIPAGELEPIVLIIDSPDTEVWEPDAFRAMGLMSQNLKLVEGVSSVRSVAMPTDGERPEDADQDIEGQIGELEQGLQEAAVGAGALEEGVVELRDGLREIDRRLPELIAGLDEAEDGADQLESGTREAGGGVAALREGVAQLRRGLQELRRGLREARDGTVRLRDEVAAPSEEAIRRGYEALVGMTIGRADPMYEPAREEFGEAYARITGEYPPGHPQAGQQVEDDYEGLTAALDEIASGLGEAVDGVGELVEGMDELDVGLAELGTGLERIAAGLDELASGLGDAVDGTQRLQAGISEMLSGVQGQMLPGVRELAAGLEEGAAEVRDADLEALLPTTGPGPFVITPGMLEARPDVREELSFFVARSGTRTRVFIGTEQASYTDTAMATVDEIVRVAEMSLRDSPLADARVLPTGPTAFLSEMDEVATQDFRLIVTAVVIGVFIVLAILLRSLVAPVYMVASVLFSFLVALGLGVFVFQHVLGHDGMAWYLPPFLFVLLVALGIDYSIFLMSRVREESMRRSTTAAVAQGLRLTGHVITSAGVILAGTFGALIVAPLTPLMQIGFTVAAGILIDTFVIRSFIVPAIAVLVGRWNWWPSDRYRAEREEAAAEQAGEPAGADEMAREPEPATSGV